MEGKGNHHMPQHFGLCKCCHRRCAVLEMGQEIKQNNSISIQRLSGTHSQYVGPKCTVDKSEMKTEKGSLGNCIHKHKFNFMWQRKLISSLQKQQQQQQQQQKWSPFTYLVSSPSLKCKGAPHVRHYIYDKWCHLYPSILATNHVSKDLIEIVCTCTFVYLS